MNSAELPHVVYIANARMPTEKAHGIQIAKMCEAFIEQGVAVEIVAPSRGRDTRTVRDFYGLRVDVPTTRLWVPDWYASRIGFVMSSLVFAVCYFLHLRLRKLRGESFTVYTTDLDQFSFFLVPFLGVPYVVEMHDAKKKRIAFRFLFWRARCVIAVNNIIKKELADVFGLAPEKIAVWPNGYDDRVFPSKEDRDVARSILGLPTDKPIVMYVGRVYPWKGIETLVAASRFLPDVLFYLVGGTAEDLRVVGAMAEQPVNLVCIRARPMAEIPRWLRAADVLLVLGTAKDTYSYLHTSPMKLFEYMAAGRPVVASCTPAIASVVSDEKVFFAAPDDAADVAEKIRFVLEHPRDAERKAAAAAASPFSWNARAAGISDFMLKHLSVPN